MLKLKTIHYSDDTGKGFHMPYHDRSPDKALKLAIALYDDNRHDFADSAPCDNTFPSHEDYQDGFWGDDLTEEMSEGFYSWCLNYSFDATFSL